MLHKESLFSSKEWIDIDKLLINGEEEPDPGLVKKDLIRNGSCSPFEVIFDWSDL